MATLILIRHGRTTANTGGVLAGRMDGVDLDDRGAEQARALGERLRDVPLARVVSSPLLRCRRTSALARESAGTAMPAELVDDGVTECGYGAWTGRKITELVKEDLWRAVQQQPSAVTFPEGEGLAEMHHRAVSAVRRHDAEVTAEHGDRAVWAVVSHGDVLKAILADALGLHLDQFQRIHVDPASASVIRYTPQRPLVLATNTRAGDLAWTVPKASEPDGEQATAGAESAGQATPGDAVVGGGAGPE